MRSLMLVPALLLTACSLEPTQVSPQPSPTPEPDNSAFTVRSADSCEVLETGLPAFRVLGPTQTGIDFIHQAAPYAADGNAGDFGAGLVADDFDGDGLTDIVFINQGGPHGLFRNVGGLRFERVADAGGLVTESPANGGSAADWDADGDIDLLIMTEDQDRLFLNNGDGTFTDHTEASGVSLPFRTLAVSWADFDEDGTLDLFACSFFSWRDNAIGIDGSEADGNGCSNGLDDDQDGAFDCDDTDCAHLQECGAEVGGPNQVWLNNGDGTFREAPDLMPAAAADSGCFASTVLDVDLDGRLDLATAHDKGGHFTRDQLFVAGDEGFEERGSELGADSCCSVMGQAAADFNGDGYDDIWKADTPTDHLLLNDGAGGFYDATAISGLVPPSGSQLTTWDLDAWDVDEDGDVDTFVLVSPYEVEGDMNPDPSLWANHLYINDGSGFFTDQGDQFEIHTDLVETRSFVRADFDQDGANDVMIVAADAGVRLLAGSCTDQGRLFVRLVGANETSAAGAQIALHTGDLAQRRFVQVGGHVQSSQPSDVHFGLAGHERIDRLEVLFPSGAEMVLEDLPINSHITIREPESP